MATSVETHASRAQNEEQRRLPEGDRGLPLIGQTLAIMTLEGNEFPMRMYKSHGRISRTRLFGKDALVVFGTETIQKCLAKDSEKSHLWLPNAAMKLLGPLNNLLHGETGPQKRALFGRWFSSKQMGTIAEDIFSLQEKMVAKWADKSCALFRNEMQWMAFHVVTDIVFNIRFPFGGLAADEMFGYFKDWAAGWYTLGLDLPFSTYRKALEASDVLVEAFSKELEYIAQHPDSDRQPGLRAVVTASTKDGYKLNTSEITANVIGIIFAGYSTISSMSGQMLLALTKHPQVWKMLRDEQERVVKELGPRFTSQALDRMVYAEAVILEVLRTGKAGPQFRLVSEPIDIGGYQIPKGWLLALYGAFSECYLDERWPFDDSFDPDRHLSAAGSKKRWPLNFGWGPHVCMGRFLTMVELKTLVANLARGYSVDVLEPDAVLKFPSMEPPNGLPVIVRKIDGGV